MRLIHPVLSRNTRKSWQKKLKQRNVHKWDDLNFYLLGFKRVRFSRRQSAHCATLVVSGSIQSYGSTSSRGWRSSVYSCGVDSLEYFLRRALWQTKLRRKKLPQGSRPLQWTTRTRSLRRMVNSHPLEINLLQRNLDIIMLTARFFDFHADCTLNQIVTSAVYWPDLSVSEWKCHESQKIYRYLWRYFSRCACELTVATPAGVVGR